jgi:TolB-like protein
VLPFVDRTPGALLRGGLGDGMAHDVITRLSKLRSLFVIAPGTMFALAERRVDSQDAGRRLDVDYVASGAVRHGADEGLAVSVQLAETRSAQVVWAQEFTGRRDDTFAVLDEIGNRIVTALASQIESAERNRAVLKNPDSLNAWEAHHRGLWHMVRLTARTTSRPATFSSKPYGWIPPSPGRTRGCRSRISRTPSRAGASVLVRSSRPMPSQPRG